MNALLKTMWIGLAATLIVSLAAVVAPDHVQIDDDGRIHRGAPAPTPSPSPSPSTAAPAPESTSPPLTRDAVDEVIRTAVGAAGLDPAQGRPTVAAGADSKRTGWMAVREKSAAQSEMDAVCADLERQGCPRSPSASADSSRRSSHRLPGKPRTLPPPAASPRTPHGEGFTSRSTEDDGS